MRKMKNQSSGTLVSEVVRFMSSRRTLAIASIVLGIVIGTWMVLLSTATAASVAKTVTQASAQYGANIPGTRTIGKPDAKLKLVLYGDFQCSHCSDLHKTIEPELIKRYIATGKVSLQVRMVRFMGNESALAAEAALCADDQGKFWQFRDALYPAYELSGKSAFSVDSLKRLAQELGLYMLKFNAAFDGGIHKNDVVNDNAQAKIDISPIKAAMASTAGAQEKIDDAIYVPSMLINGRLIEGSRPLAEYVKVIEEELAK
jgi:protein-disulfide isomerase